VIGIGDEPGKNDAYKNGRSCKKCAQSLHKCASAFSKSKHCALSLYGIEAVENTDGKRQCDEIDAIILIASFDIVSGYLK